MAMARHGLWSGVLKFSLVACPVRLFSALNARNEFSFHLINPSTGNRIRTVLLDRETDAPVERKDLVKGYEYAKGQYIQIEEQDIDALRIESSNAMAIERFVSKETIEPIYFDQAYYVAPDGDVAIEAYVVIRDSLAAMNKAAIARIVIARRERAVALMPGHGGLIAFALRNADEVRDPAEHFSDLADVVSDKAMVTIAEKIIEQNLGGFDPHDYKDRFELRLHELIEARLEGEEPPDGGGIDVSPPGNVVDLMALLKKSVGAKTNTAVKTAARRKDTAKKKAAPAAKSKIRSKRRSR